MTAEYPHSEFAEQAVLGSILIQPDEYHVVSSSLRPDDFYIVRNAWVYEAIGKVIERGEHVDNLTVAAELTAQSHLDDIGGTAYLVLLINNTPSYFHAETYAKLVEAAAARRRLLKAANQIAHLALEANETVETITDAAEKALFEASSQRGSSEVEPVSSIVSRYYDQIDKLHEGKRQLLGVTTGFEDLNKVLSGLQPDTLYLIAARPSVGKTALALQLAYNAGLSGVGSLFCSLEMSKELLINRLVGNVAGIDTQALQLGKLTQEQWDRFTTVTANAERWPIYIDDAPYLSVAKLRSRARLWQRRGRIGTVFVDYLQLMSAPRREKREQEISAISQGLKALAKDLHLPVIACCQLNRASEIRKGHRPQLSDLRESGSLEQDSDVVIAIHRDPKRPLFANLLILKNRNGPTGDIELGFQPEYTRYRTKVPDYGPVPPGYGERNDEDSD